MSNNIIIIEVFKGAVGAVYFNNKNTQVIVADHDVNKDRAEEIASAARRQVVNGSMLVEHP